MMANVTGIVYPNLEFKEQTFDDISTIQDF